MHISEQPETINDLSCCQCLLMWFAEGVYCTLMVFDLLGSLCFSDTSGRVASVFGLLICFYRTLLVEGPSDQSAWYSYIELG